MRAIVLAGGQDTHLVPLARTLPKPLLPVANRPLIEHLLLLLRENGVRDIAVALGSRVHQYQSILGDGRKYGVHLTYATETAPRGTAGCLLPLADFIGEEPFLVVQGSLFVETDLRALEEFHLRRRATATVVVQEAKNGSRDWHHMELGVGEDSRINDIEIRDLSEAKRRSRIPVGLYLFDPSVLDAIKPGIYFDIKEQLIPFLREKKRRILAYEMGGFCQNMVELADYLRINRAVLRGDVNGYQFESPIADGIWVGNGSEVAPSASLLGPVMIGRDCVIGPNVQIVGPACVGDGCVVEEGVLVRESFLLPGARVAPNAKVEESVLAADTVLGPGQSLRRVVAIPDRLTASEIDFADADLIIRGVAESPARFAQSRISYFWYRAFKRIFDLCASAFGLIVFSPLVLIVMIAIKLHSPGPIFFRERRCGKRGREFWMIKFRTMVKDAEKMQAKLLPLNEVDGPIFKMENDPRSTSLGRILRRFSIDELPQLWNVFKGEMSLVGPRPLSARELRLCPAWRDARLVVRPGITGLWQVSGRSKSSFHDWIRLDIEYVRNRSFILDMKILLKTLWVVIRGVGSS